MERIGVIGHFGGGKKFYDGQTVKTENFCEMLQSTGKYTFFKVDTYFNTKNKLKLLLDTIGCLFTCKKIVILLSGNGLRFYLPFLYYSNKLFRRKIFHNIIGGNLHNVVKKRPKYVKYLNSFSVNWYEIEDGSREMKKAGVQNVVTLPNCKFITPVSLSEFDNKAYLDASIRFCTFSRVMKEKGITAAVEAVVSVNEKMGKNAVYLDVFGQIEPEYAKEFDALVRKYSDCVQYKGCVASEDSVQVLKSYYAMLFPTYWQGEGFPGTVLDAFASGLPVIATDFNANAEIIEDGKTGLIYPGKYAETLDDAVYFAEKNRDVFLKMKRDCLLEYDKYTPSNILKQICRDLERK